MIRSIDVIFIHAGLFQIHSLDQEMSLYFISIYTWVNYEALDTNKTRRFTCKGNSASKWLLIELHALAHLNNLKIIKPNLCVLFEL